MAAAETTQPRHAIRAGGLAAALLIAKAAALVGRGASLTLSATLAYVWLDVAAALLFWCLDTALRRSRWLWAVYGIITAYIILNVPVVATLGSPLTPTMIRAAGGALGDSVRSALTLSALGSMSAVALAAIAGPWLAGRLPRVLRLSALPVAVMIAVTGAIASRGVETGGLHRNALSTLVTTALPRVGATASTADFRTSPFADRLSEDLTPFRGAGTGLNVLLVALESTGARYLASYGAKDDPTPVFTSLARESMLFESAYAAYPESIKGLFAVLCSMAPAFDVPAETLARMPCDSVVGHLSTARYRTGLFHAGRFAYLGMQDVVNAHRFDVAADAGAISGRIESSFGVDEPAVVARLLQWIDAAPRDRPFFATYLPAAGHHPYESTTPGPFSQDTALGAYKNAIHEGDAALGTLLDGLRARGLADRTLIIVFGDHGEAFDQHPGNRVHSLYVYDENVRVPLIVHLPDRGQESTARRVRRVASVIDIGPTILDLLGLPPQRDIQGVSLLEPRERMALFHADYDRGWLGLRDGCRKFLFEIDARRSRLFDVCADPDETRDLAGSDPVSAGVYRTRVEQWAAAQRAAVLRAAARN